MPMISNKESNHENSIVEKIKGYPVDTNGTATPSTPQRTQLASDPLQLPTPSVHHNHHPSSFIQDESPNKKHCSPEKDTPARSSLGTCVGVPKALVAANMQRNRSLSPSDFIESQPDLNNPDHPTSSSFLHLAKLPSFPCCLCGSPTHPYNACSKYNGTQLAVLIDGTCVALNIIHWAGTTVADLISTVRRIPALAPALTCELRFYLGTHRIPTRTFEDKRQLIRSVGLVPGTVLVVMLAGSARHRLAKQQADPPTTHSTSRGASPDRVVTEEVMYASHLYKDPKTERRALQPTTFSTTPTKDGRPSDWVIPSSPPWGFTSTDPSHQQAASEAISMAANEVQQQIEWLHQAQQLQYEQMAAWQNQQEQLLAAWRGHSFYGNHPQRQAERGGQHEGHSFHVDPEGLEAGHDDGDADEDPHSRSLSPMSVNGLPSIRNQPPPLLLGRSSQCALRQQPLDKLAMAADRSSPLMSRSLSPMSPSTNYLPTPIQTPTKYPIKGMPSSKGVLSANAPSFVPHHLRSDVSPFAPPATDDVHPRHTAGPVPEITGALLAPSARRLLGFHNQKSQAEAPVATLETPTTTTSIVMSPYIPKQRPQKAHDQLMVEVDKEEGNTKSCPLDPAKSSLERCLVNEYTPIVAPPVEPGAVPKALLPSVPATPQPAESVAHEWDEGTTHKDTKPCDDSNAISKLKGRRVLTSKSLTTTVEPSSPAPIVKLLKREKDQKAAMEMSAPVQEENTSAVAKKDSAKDTTSPTAPTETDEDYLRRVMLAYGTENCARTAPLQYLVGPLISLQATVCDQILSKAKMPKATQRVVRDKLKARMGDNSAALLRPLHEICDATKLRSIAYRLWSYQVTCEAQEAEAAGEKTKISKVLSTQRAQVANYRALCTVCISFIPAEMGNFQLRLLLDCFGVPLAIRVIMPKSFGNTQEGSNNSAATPSNLFKMVFAEFSCPEEAARIITELHGHCPTPGMHLRVDYASNPITGRLRYDAMVREAHLIEDYGNLNCPHKRDDLVVPNIKMKDRVAAELYDKSTAHNAKGEQKKVVHDVHPTWREPPLNADSIGHSFVRLPPSSAAHPRQSKQFNIYGASGEALKDRASYLCPINGVRYWFISEQVSSTASFHRHLVDYTGSTEEYYIAPCSFGLTAADISTAYTGLLDLRRYPMKPKSAPEAEPPVSTDDQQPARPLNPALAITVFIPGSLPEPSDNEHPATFPPLLAGSRHIKKLLEKRYARFSNQPTTIRDEAIELAATYLREAVEHVQAYYRTKRSTRRLARVALLDSMKAFVESSVFGSNWQFAAVNQSARKARGSKRLSGGKTKEVQSDHFSATDTEATMSYLRTELTSWHTLGEKRSRDNLPVTLRLLKALIQVGYRFPAAIDESYNAVVEHVGQSETEVTEQAAREEKRRPATSGKATANENEKSAGLINDSSAATELVLEGIVRLATCGDGPDGFGMDLNTYLPLSPMFRNAAEVFEPLTDEEANSIRVIVESSLVHGLLYSIVGVFALGVRSNDLDEHLLPTEWRERFPRLAEDAVSAASPNKNRKSGKRAAAAASSEDRCSKSKASSSKRGAKSDAAALEDDFGNLVEVTKSYEFPSDIATKGLRLLARPEELAGHLQLAKASRFTVVHNKFSKKNANSFEAPTVIFVTATGSLVATRLLCQAGSDVADLRAIVAPTQVSSTQQDEVPATPPFSLPKDNAGSSARAVVSVAGQEQQSVTSTANLKVSALLASMLGCGTGQSIVDVSAISSVTTDLQLSYTNTPLVARAADRQGRGRGDQTPPAQCLETPGSVVIPITKFSTPKIATDADQLCAAILNDCADAKSLPPSTKGGFATRNVEASTTPLLPPISFEDIETAASLYFPKHFSHLTKSSAVFEPKPSSYPTLPPIPSLLECRDSQAVLVSYGTIFESTKDDAVLALIRAFQMLDGCFEGVEEVAEKILAMGRTNFSSITETAAEELKAAIRRRVGTSLSIAFTATERLLDITDASKATMVEFLGVGTETQPPSYHQFRFQGHKSTAAFADACVLRICLLSEMLAVVGTWSDRATEAGWWPEDNAAQQSRLVASHMSRKGWREADSAPTTTSHSSSHQDSSTGIAIGVASLGMPRSPAVVGPYRRTHLTPKAFFTTPSTKRNESTPPIVPSTIVNQIAFSASQRQQLRECQRALAQAVANGAIEAVRDCLPNRTSPDAALFELVRNLCDVASEGVYRYQAILNSWRAELAALKVLADKPSIKESGMVAIPTNSIVKMLATAVGRKEGISLTAPTPTTISASELALRIAYGNALLSFGYLEGRSLATKLLQTGILLESGTAPHLASMLYHQGWLACDTLDIVNTTIANNVPNPTSSLSNVTANNVNAANTSNTSVLSATTLLHNSNGNGFLTRNVLSQLHNNGSASATVNNSLNTSSVQANALPSPAPSSYQRLLNNCPNRPVSGRNSNYYKMCVEKLRQSSLSCGLLQILFPDVHDQLVAVGMDFAKFDALEFPEPECDEEDPQFGFGDEANAASNVITSKRTTYRRRLLKGKIAASVLAKAPPTLHRWHILQGCAMLRDETVFDPTVVEIDTRKDQLKARGYM